MGSLSAGTYLVCSTRQHLLKTSESEVFEVMLYLGVSYWTAGVDAVGSLGIHSVHTCVYIVSMIIQLLYLCIESSPRGFHVRGWLAASR